MNREEQYYKSVDILLDAYNRGTLQHANCDRCAVGNLLGHGDWINSFATGAGINHENIVTKCGSMRNPSWDSDWTNETEYSVSELMKIEDAFERDHVNSFIGKSEDELHTANRLASYQYEGLCRVLDCLKEIHEVDQPIIDDHKDQFKSIYEEKYLISAG